MKISDEKAMKIKADYENGVKIAQIKSAYNVPIQSIYNILEYNNVILRNSDLHSGCYCPYYMQESNNRIACFVDGKVRLLKISFDNKRSKDDFKRAYCNSAYHLCPLYQCSNIYSN